MTVLPASILLDACMHVADLRCARRPFFRAWLGEEEMNWLADHASGELMKVVSAWEALDWPPETRSSGTPLPGDLLVARSAFRDRVLTEIETANGPQPFSTPLPAWNLHCEDDQYGNQGMDPPGLWTWPCDAGEVLANLCSRLQFISEMIAKFAPEVTQGLQASSVDQCREHLAKWEALAWPPWTPDELGWSLPNELITGPGALRAAVEPLLGLVIDGSLKVTDVPKWGADYTAAFEQRRAGIWEACAAFEMNLGRPGSVQVVFPPLPSEPDRGARPSKPEPRLIRHWSDAEHAACDWMRWMGFSDAALTPGGTDGGADIVASNAVAQVKDWGGAIPIAEVQRMVGVAAEHGRDLRVLIFARAGYTQQAIDSAERLEIALFEFDLTGEPTPITTHARRLMAA